jgi:hypothetical protein
LHQGSIFSVFFILLFTLLPTHLAHVSPCSLCNDRRPSILFLYLFCKSKTFTCPGHPHWPGPWTCAHFAHAVIRHCPHPQRNPASTSSWWSCGGKRLEVTYTTRKKTMTKFRITGDNLEFECSTCFGSIADQIVNSQKAAMSSIINQFSDAWLPLLESHTSIRVWCFHSRWSLGSSQSSSRSSDWFADTLAPDYRNTVTSGPECCRLTVELQGPLV